jgi:DNA-binding CsgD family transcriptional regulator
VLRAPTDAARAWPLTGRRIELEGCVTAVLSDDVDAVLVTGPAGVGKSRLMRELVDRLDPVVSAAWITGSASTTRVPLGALAHVLPRQVSTDPAVLLAQARAALVGTASADGDDKLLVLALDDVHLLDPTTVALLAQLLWAGGTRLAATLPELAAAPEPLQMVWRSGRARIVDLQPLDDLAVDTLVHRALGGPVDGAAMLALLDASAGNPLFLRELVLGSLTAGTLEETAGVWRMVGAPEPSGMLRALVQRRVSSLGPDVHALLEDIAIGAPGGLDDLAGRHGDLVLERAERAGLLRVTTSGRRRAVSLTHGLHADVLRDSVGSVATRRLARLHAESVERHGRRRRDDDWRVAVWRLSADGSAPVELLSRATLLARAARDLDSVERLARAALSRGADATVARALAETLFERGRVTQALDVIHAAHGDDDLADVGLRATEALILGFGRRDFDQAVELLESTRARSGPGPASSRLAAPLALLLVWRSGPTEALRTLADGELEPLDTASARTRRAVSTVALALSGQTADAVAMADDASVAGPGLRVACRVLALMEAGRLVEAEALAKAGHTASARAGLRWQQLWFAGGIGRIALLAGRPRQSTRWLREQAALAEALGHVPGAQLGLAGLLTAAAWLHDDALLAESWQGWLRLGADEHEPSLLPADIARGLAWRAVRTGDLGAAHSLLADVQSRCEDRGHLGQAALAAYERVRLGRAAEVADDLRRYADAGDSPLVDAYAQHARAAAQEDAGQLAEVADQLWSMGLVLAAVEATAAAATAAGAGQDPRRAAALARLATSRRAEAEGASTPALATAPAGGARSLTRREREIALLVTQGRSSRHIADTLTLSVRTVDNHLQRIFAKLGVTGRAEVKAALEEVP